MYRLTYIFIALLASLCFPNTTLAQTPLKGKSLFGDMRARQIGPAVTSGRISDLDVLNSDPQIMYVGAAGGGVWKSTTAGATFRPVFDEHTQSIGKITIDQKNPKTVWVGTGETWVRNSVSVGTGIYKTTDGGRTWKNMGLENSERIADIIIHPENSDVVFVAVLGPLWNASEERGFYKTSDGGKTWEKLFYIDENTGFADLDIDPKNPDILYATTWQFRRRPDFFNSGGPGSAVYKSTDGGKTWNKIQNGLPKGNLGRMAISVAPSNGEVIYLSVECEKEEEKGMYLSTDAGASWKLISSAFGTKVRPFYFSRVVTDPKNDSIVYKCGLNLIISEDRAERFRTVSSGVHSDIHAVWVDPNNTKHVIIGTDGGVYESFDRGYTFKMFMNLPVAQFYHISVDNAQPYKVYGGLQDNGSWSAPSRKAGGITNGDWQQTYGGDGFYSFPHPTDEDIIYAEYQGGEIVRYNRKTGQAKSIKPYPQKGEPELRFNWNSPIHISPNNPERLYFGCQFVLMSEDRGDSWKRLSGDLTTNNPSRQEQYKSGGLSIDNSTAENNTTIYTISESPVDENVIWVGTDDGNLQVSADFGKTWTNVVVTVPGLPKNTWVSHVEAGHYDKNTAYVTFDGHRQGDMKTYVFKTTDLGKTWTALVTEDIEGYAHIIREDLKNQNLLFLGTEFGLYISLDAGKSWSRFENNVPKVGIRDMVIHPREDALVIGSHGRGVIILDDITPLRQLSSEVLAKKFHFLETKPTILRDPGSGGGWFSGAGNFVGANPNSSAKIIYYMSKRHTFGKMYVEVYDEKDKLLKKLPAGKRAGINVVTLSTSIPPPKSAPTNNRNALFGSFFGPSLAAGKYKVKVVKGKEEFVSNFTLMNDPQSPYSQEGRAYQRKLAFQLYDMSEHLAYVYEGLKNMEDKARSHAENNKKLAKKLNTFADDAAKFSASLVSLRGDFYVNSGEKIRERISNLYRYISSYPGKPSDSQAAQAQKLEEEMKEIMDKFEAMKNQELPKINAALSKAELEEIKIESLEDFKNKKG